MNASSLEMDTGAIASGAGPLSPLPGHVEVAGVPVFNGAADDVLRLCHERIAAGIGTRIATANLDFLAIARRDTRLKEHLNSSHLVLADGKPVAMLARVAGATQTARVAGVDLVGNLLSGHALPRLRVALYGATEPASRAAADAFAAYDRVHVAARVVPPFRPLTPEEEREERARIREAEPHLVLVALGCPRQEQVISRYFDEAPTATWIGVGGTLDFFAGSRKRAPRWVQDAGGEWLVRLAQEPRRLWRRYLLRDVPALAAVAPPVCGAAVRRRFRS